MTFYLSMLLTLYSIEGKIMACFEIVSDRIDPMLKNPLFSVFHNSKFRARTIGPKRKVLNCERRARRGYREAEEINFVVP